MSTNLVALDEDPEPQAAGRRHPHRGRPPPAGPSAAEALAQTWAWFSQFKDLVDPGPADPGHQAPPVPRPAGRTDPDPDRPCVELATEQVPARRTPPARRHPDDAALHPRRSAAAACRASTTRSTPSPQRRARPGTTCSPPPSRHRRAEPAERPGPLARRDPRARAAPVPRPSLDRLTDGAGHRPPVGRRRGPPTSCSRRLAATAADLDRLALLRQQAAAQVDQARATLAELDRGASPTPRRPTTETSAKISRPRVAPPPALDPAWSTARSA